MRAVDEAPKGKKTALADWKEGPDEILAEVDKQLKAFGLEIVEVAPGTSDTAEWYIDKRKEKKKAK